MGNTQNDVGSAYVLSVWLAETQYTVMVWNGIEDYSRIPSPENLATVKMGGLKFGGTVVIAQIGKPTNCNGRSTVRTLQGLLGTNQCDGVILWARDTKTYKSIRNELRTGATRNLDGSLKI
jgi:hypothetical protein